MPMRSEIILPESMRFMEFMGRARIKQHLRVSFMRNCGTLQTVLTTSISITSCLRVNTPTAPLLQSGSKMVLSTLVVTQPAQAIANGMQCSGSVRNVVSRDQPATFFFSFPAQTSFVRDTGVMRSVFIFLEPAKHERYRQNLSVY